RQLADQPFVDEALQERGALAILLEEAPTERIDEEEDDGVILPVKIPARAKGPTAPRVASEAGTDSLRNLCEPVAVVKRAHKGWTEPGRVDGRKRLWVDHRPS